MIRFACPRCLAVYSAPEAAAGRESACRGCGQRLRVPDAPAPVHEPVTAEAPPQAIPVAAEGRPGRFNRRLLWAVPVGLVAILATWLVGYRLISGGWRSPGQTVEARSFTRSSEEELVRRYILNNLREEDAGQVRFVAWGPHLSNAEWLALWREAGLGRLAELAPKEDVAKGMKMLSAIDGIIRVQYTRPGREWNPKHGTIVEEADELYLVMKGTLVTQWPVRGKAGDDWKKEMRKEVSKTLPALKP